MALSCAGAGGSFGCCRSAGALLAALCITGAAPPATRWRKILPCSPRSICNLSPSAAFRRCIQAASPVIQQCLSSPSTAIKNAGQKEPSERSVSTNSTLGPPAIGSRSFPKTIRAVSRLTRHCPAWRVRSRTATLKPAPSSAPCAAKGQDIMRYMWKGVRERPLALCRKLHRSTPCRQCRANCSVSCGCTSSYGMLINKQPFEYYSCCCAFGVGIVTILRHARQGSGGSPDLSHGGSVGHFLPC